ncbi:MAG TPA: FAD-dependent oxidoreductase, partial [Geminicoccaceae bacterium]
GLDVTLLHLAPWLMERQLDREAGAVLRARIEGLGIRVLLEASTDRILGDGRARALRLKDGREIPAGLVVMAVGVRPETALARGAGLECGRGILVDDTLTTSDQDIAAIGECAEHRSLVYGLVLPAYEQAEVLARRLAGDTGAHYEGSVTYTSLKVSGVPVFSAGEVADEAPGEALLFRDPRHGIYKRLLLRDDRLVGAVLVGEVSDGSWYADLIRAGRDVAPMRGLIAFGRAFAEPALDGAGALDLAA